MKKEYRTAFNMGWFGSKEPKIVILGTIPGEKSNENFEYYKNTHNRFWKIINNVLLKDKTINYKTWTYYAKDEKPGEVSKESILIKNFIALNDIFSYAKVVKSENPSQQNRINNKKLIDDIIKMGKPLIVCNCKENSKDFREFIEELKHNGIKNFVFWFSTSGSYAVKGIQEKQERLLKYWLKKSRCNMLKLKLNDVIKVRTLNQLANILVREYGFDNSIKNQFTAKNYCKKRVKNKYSLWFLNYSDWNKPKTKPEHVKWTNYISTFQGGYEITEMWHELEDPQTIEAYNDVKDLRITFAKDPKRDGYVFLGIVRCTNIGLQIGKRWAKTYSTYQKEVEYQAL